MTETSVFPNGSAVIDPKTGYLVENLEAFGIPHESVITASTESFEPLADTTIHAGLDVTRGIFITGRGDEIELSGKPINKLLLERLVNEGKPRIPRKEVLLLGKHKELQANANDPDYLALMEEWSNDLKIKTMRYLFQVGVKGMPPQSFIDEQRQITPDANNADMKYFWLGSLLSDDELVALQEVIVGMNFTTTKGLEEAADSFRS